MRALLACILLAPYAIPQSLSPDRPPGVLLLSRVKARIKQQLAHMPQYTCLETLQRFYKLAALKAEERQLDTVRLEVLFSGKSEFFDFPGATDFRESNPSKFVTSGMIGNGMFASHLQNIFVEDHGLFEYRGEEDLDGRRAARFHFHVSALESGFNIRVPGAQANVAMAGTFWADPSTYDLIRIEIGADAIPEILQTSQMVTTMEYAHTLIGTQTTMLPQNGTLLLRRESGEVSFDRFEFTHCMEYHAESTISFSDPDVPTPPAAIQEKNAKPAVAGKPLPAGLTVSIALTAPLTDNASVGQPIEGRVVGKVVSRVATIIPDGALVRGRIRRLERFRERDGYFSIGLEFEDVEVNGARLRFFAELQSADPVRELEWQLPPADSGRAKADRRQPATPLHSDSDVVRETFERLAPPDLPGVGAFFMRGPHFELPAGFRTKWKTRAM